MKNHRFIIALCAILLGASPPAYAKISSLDSFARLPVQDGGRIMPMDSFARLRLLQFSGRSAFNQRPAMDWLARLVFTPESAHDDKIFVVNNPEVLEALDVKTGGGRRYSFNDLQGGMEKLSEMAKAASAVAEEDRSAVEKEILRLYQNLSTYLELFHSFQFALPHDDFAVSNQAVRARLDLPAGVDQFSFFDLYEHIPRAADEVQALGKTDQAEWTDDQRALFNLSATLFQWGQFYRGLPIAMIPLRGHGQEQWVSPWDVLALGLADEDVHAEISWLQDVARAYVVGRQVEFDIAAHSFERSVLGRAEQGRSIRHLSLELLYNRLDPFYRAEWLYGLGFLLCLIFMLMEKPMVRRGALVLVLLALIPHSLGLISRMMIMGRPPVTNLFATFIFVSWICVALGLALEAFQRNALGILLSSVAGLVLLMVSGRFVSQGDTLSVVVAVLDSNFWLSTHVVSITIGYAGCVAAGLVGHLYLLQALRCPPDHPSLANTARAVYGLLAFGLIFSFLGAVLGGVWADQSWGRFWGWDPKENGALLIVLWCSLLFHARVSKMIGPLGMAAGSVLGVIVVLMAWLGINLLGVGLHSYGFTSGLARGLWLSVSFELLFVAFTLPFVKKAPTVA